MMIMTMATAMMNEKFHYNLTQFDTTDFHLILIIQSIPTKFTLSFRNIEVGKKRGNRISSLNR